MDDKIIYISEYLTKETLGNHRETLHSQMVQASWEALLGMYLEQNGVPYPEPLKFTPPTTGGTGPLPPLPPAAA